MATYRVRTSPLSAMLAFGMLAMNVASLSVSGSAQMVHDIDVATTPPGNGAPSFLAVFNGKLYFQANDGTNGRELWVYDGTNTPSMVHYINSGGSSSPTYLAVFNGKLYFNANDGTNGRELWVYELDESPPSSPPSSPPLSPPPPSSTSSTSSNSSTSSTSSSDSSSDIGAGAIAAIAAGATVTVFIAAIAVAFKMRKKSSAKVVDASVAAAAK